MTKCYPQNAEKNYQCNKASEYSHTLHQKQRTKKNIALVNTENGEVITMYYSNPNKCIHCSQSSVPIKCYPFAIQSSLNKLIIQYCSVS